MKKVSQTIEKTETVVSDAGDENILHAQNVSSEPLTADQLRQAWHVLSQLLLNVRDLLVPSTKTADEMAVWCANDNRLPADAEQLREWIANFSQTTASNNGVVIGMIECVLGQTYTFPAFVKEADLPALYAHAFTSPGLPQSEVGTSSESIKEIN